MEYTDLNTSEERQHDEIKAEEFGRALLKREIDLAQREDISPNAFQASLGSAWLTVCFSYSLPPNEMKPLMKHMLEFYEQKWEEAQNAAARTN